MPPYNASSWKKLLKGYASDAKFGCPCPNDNLIEIEKNLHLQLPEQLKDFLREANGFQADYGSDVILSADKILKRNRDFRSNAGFKELYMPFTHSLLFGDDGGGDQFFFAIQADGQIHNHDIFRWEHESDARSWFASNLEQFFERRLKKQPEDESDG